MSNEVTRKEFAELLRVKPSYITKLSDQGRLVLTDDGKLVKVKESMALIEATKGGRQDVAQRHKESRTVSHETPDAPLPDTGTASADEIVAELLHALTSPSVEKVIKAVPTAANLVKGISDARRSAALADQEEMNSDMQAGNLIAREDVDFVLNDYGATLRGLLENLADRLAPVVYPLKTLEETHAAINEAADALQQEMAETMRRRMEEVGK